MSAGQYPAWLESVYLIQQNMCYLAVSEGLDLHETSSYISKLQNYSFEVCVYAFICITLFVFISTQ